MRDLTIAGRRIADDEPAYVVAEIGANHMGDLERCCDLFEVAIECGVDAVKLQKRDLSTLKAQHPDWWTTPYESENAFGRTYGAHREWLEFDQYEYGFLKELAKAYQKGAAFFATTWDLPSVTFLYDLGVPAIKIASASIVDHDLLRCAAEVGVPLIVSTGGATMREVDRAVDLIWPINSQLALLQCTSIYPCEPEDMHLRVIETYRKEYPEIVVGLSDHQDGIAMALPAYMVGARIFEKHFTLHRSWKGSDQAFSLEPPGMKRLVRDLARARVALGDGEKRRLPGEIPALVKMGRVDLVEGG